MTGISKRIISLHSFELHPGLLFCISFTMAHNALFYWFQRNTFTNGPDIPVVFFITHHFFYSTKTAFFMLNVSGEKYCSACWFLCCSFFCPSKLYPVAYHFISFRIDCLFVHFILFAHLQHNGQRTHTERAEEKKNIRLNLVYTINFIAELIP